MFNKRVLKLNLLELKNERTNIEVQIGRLEENLEMFQFVYSSTEKNSAKKMAIAHVKEEIAQLKTKLRNIEYEIRKIRGELEYGEDEE